MSLMGTAELNRVIDTQEEVIEPVAEGVQAWVREATQSGGDPLQRAKGFLNGTWLGHPLHPALTDIPIGAWFTGMVLDVLGAREGADACVTLGCVAAVPTALAGLADWSDTEGRPRRYGLVHALLNTVALTCFVWSALARRRGKRAQGMALSTLGLTIATVSARLGGEMVYAQGTGVNRNAWQPQTGDWQAAADVSNLVEDKLTGGEITVEGQKVPVVLLKRGTEVLALNGVCSHLGGPLAEGTLVGGECVQCPWHGSQFSMRDGSVQQGPAVYDQPRFDVRLVNGKVEVRPANSTP